MAEIKRKKNESFEAFLRRVKKRWQQSGKILQAKKIQFYKPVKSKNMRKRSTLHKIQKGEQIEYLKKTGKIKDDQQNRYKR